MIAALRLVVTLGLLLTVATPAEAHSDPAAPASTPAPDPDEQALLRRVQEHQASARFAEAAEASEQYAARYPDRPAVPELLTAAAQMRVALGQRALAFADLERAEAVLQRVDPARAAELYWSRRALLARDDERLAHAETFLARHGKLAAPDHRVVAELTIAESTWRAACRGLLEHDLCVAPPGKRTRPRRTDAEAPRRCADASARPVIVTREPRRAADAQRRFAVVLQLASRFEAAAAALAPERRREYEHAVALAALYTADQRREQLFAIPTPGDLGFAVNEVYQFSDDPRHRRQYAAQARRRADSQRRFAAYYEATTKLASALEREYGELVASHRSPRAAIVATARVAELTRQRADDVLAIELPGELHARTQVEAYCAELREKTAPLYTRADEMHAACLARAIRSGEPGELCEPGPRPGLRELIPDASVEPATRMHTIGVQTDPAPFMPAAADET